MKNLFIAMSAVEAIAGIGLLASPSLIASLLLGASLESAVSVVVSRLCGAALLSLGIACFLARDEADTLAAIGIVIAMLVYNAAATALLGYSRLGLGFMGIALWPVIAIHAALTVWCGVSLRYRPRNPPPPRKLLAPPL